MEIEDLIATSACERFVEDGVVSPASLRKSLFTVGALDNLDHNPSSTTSITSFHGTGISLFQLPTKTKPGERQAVKFLNPGQIPVTTFDQPLFALAKFVQWKWPDTHGERVHVVMLGGLHTEMALWNTLGDVLESSGWTTALTEAEVASFGTADSYLKAAHLTRTSSYLVLQNRIS